MYQVLTDQTSSINVFAGNFPVVTEVGAVQSGATVRKLAPLITTTTGLKEATSTTLADLCGISAAEPTDGGVVYYLTGEFFTEALTLPTDVTAANLKPAFRKLGIFLR